jgi:hypothetical protein
LAYWRRKSRAPAGVLEREDADETEADEEDRLGTERREKMERWDDEVDMVMCCASWFMRMDLVLMMCDTQ